MIEFADKYRPGAIIKVIGIGGGGGNAVNTMISSGLQGVEFIAANTDVQALRANLAPVKIQLGELGLGAGGKPEIGRQAALDTAERIREHLTGAHMVFLAAGMGGGTGTGGAPVVARLAKEEGALTVAVVTKPFHFEGRLRMQQAEEGIRELRDAVDALITIPNQRLLAITDRNCSLAEAFRMVDEILLQAVRGISDLITVEGLINRDFADVRTIMCDAGLTVMGTGRASGENRAIEAARQAISSPLLDDLSIEGARGILLNFTGSPGLSVHEVDEAANLIKQHAHEDVNLMWGAVIDESLQDEVQVTVIATGFGDDREAPRRTATGNGQAQWPRASQPTGARRVVYRGAVTDHPEAPTLELPPERGPASAAAEPDGPSFFLPEQDVEDDLSVPAFLRRKSGAGPVNGKRDREALEPPPVRRANR